MGRTAAYTGQVITPDMILNSKEDLSPPRYEFGPLAMPPFRARHTSLREPRDPRFDSVETHPHWLALCGDPRVQNFATALFRRSCKTLASGSTTICSGSNGQVMTDVCATRPCPE